ncbi:hypothetical protein FRX31_002453, partial [Thalictrum thalictroides]
CLLCQQIRAKAYNMSLIPGGINVLIFKFSMKPDVATTLLSEVQNEGMTTINSCSSKLQASNHRSNMSRLFRSSSTSSEEHLPTRAQCNLQGWQAAQDRKGLNLDRVLKNCVFGGDY